MGFDPLSFLTVFGLSIAAGFIGSLLGLGGGIIVTPVLTTGLGYNIRHVIGASLVSVIATSSGAAAAYVKDRLTNLRIAMFLEMATTLGAIGGAYVSGLLPVRALYVLFGVLLVYSAYGMFQRRHVEGAGRVPESAWARRLRLEGRYHDETSGKTIEYRAGRLGGGFAVMLGAGGLSGVLGIGSGVFKVLGMDMVMGLPIKVSTATSNFMIGVTAAAGAGVHFARGNVHPGIAAPVALGVLVGAWAGSKLLPRLPGRFLRYAFVPLLVYMGLEMIWKGVVP
ncbi:sulfite exporter TauE/SafE family protein [Carboxydochorda subterranea]|uniref:Probable membrane transporter protein n=1 Tax=Carboxydichorda subterranea TaxID=3109565 RepID=A0ABZ1C018_9FIRM|nr:sulfite exporter TauE/SafE family protein [Limnochorda sp. L945t]WRP18185.1 sulfite exporter TauE/SafE family protein [Limnochorda sp. L945t]